jgi:hypothetical protein
MQLSAGEILAGFGQRRNEVRMFGTGQRYHRVTMRERREMLLQLVRRSAGRNEMNFVKIKTPVGGARHRQMSIMNRVKGAAKNRNATGMVFGCSAALRLRGGQ